jgi:hypothetical protein
LPRFHQSYRFPLKLQLEGVERGADAIIRVPANRESVFRAAVSRGNTLVADVIQVWLETANYPSRGREQADEIWRRILKPVLGKRA